MSKLVVSQDGKEYAEYKDKVYIGVSGGAINHVPVKIIQAALDEWHEKHADSYLQLKESDGSLFGKVPE